MDKEIWQILCIVVACGFMAIGAQIDRKERRYPNEIVLITTLLGFTLSLITDRLNYAFMFCFIIHILGVIDGITFHFMNAGDWKMLATLMLFIPFEDSKIMIGFIGIVTLICVLTKLFSLRHINFHNLIQSFKQERDLIKCHFLIKEQIIPSETNELYKIKTVPVTLIFFAAWIICQFISISGL